MVRPMQLQILPATPASQESIVPDSQDFISDGNMTTQDEDTQELDETENTEASEAVSMEVEGNEYETSVVNETNVANESSVASNDNDGQSTGEEEDDDEDGDDDSEEDEEEGSSEEGNENEENQPPPKSTFTKNGPTVTAANNKAKSTSSSKSTASTSTSTTKNLPTIAPKKNISRKDHKSSKSKSKKKLKMTYSLYIYKVFKTLFKDLTMSSHSMVIVDSFVIDMFERVAREASVLARMNKKRTIGPREIQTAVALLIPGDLGKHAMAEGSKAVYLYEQNRAQSEKDKEGKIGGGSSGGTSTKTVKKNSKKTKK